MLLKEKYPDMPLTKGYVFKSCFGHREDLMKRLLEIVLNIQIVDIKIQEPEHDIEPIKDKAGGRLDIYVVDAEGNEYDIEAQTYRNRDEVLRARRYHALMDADRIKKGDTDKLRELFHKSTIVFICDFDPFGAGLPVYDTFMHCVQTDELVDDGRRATYLNTTVELKDEDDSDLYHLIRYINGEADEDEWDDPLARGIVDEMDKNVKDPKWMDVFMTYEEEIRIARDNAHMEGKEKGKKEELNQIRKLKSALKDAGRYDELDLALDDDDVYESLLDEFHID